MDFKSKHEQIKAIPITEFTSDFHITDFILSTHTKGKTPEVRYCRFHDMKTGWILDWSDKGKTTPIFCAPGTHLIRHESGNLTVMSELMFRARYEAENPARLAS